MKIRFFSLLINNKLLIKLTLLHAIFYIDFYFFQVRGFNIIQNVSSEFIIKGYECISIPSSYIFTMEFCPIDLGKFLQNIHSSSLTALNSLRLMYQMTQALLILKVSFFNVLFFECYL